MIGNLLSNSRAQTPFGHALARLLLLALASCMFVGCAVATRLHVPPDQASYRFLVHHSESKAQAFSKVELALAEAYTDLPAVLKLKQPDTGTFLLKPLVTYQAGGSMGAVQHARYTLKIVVETGSVTLNFELGPEESNATWAPEAEIPKIKQSFTEVAAKVATAVGGKLQ